MRAHRGLEPPDEVWMQGLGTPLWVQFRHWPEDPAEIDAMVPTYPAYNLDNTAPLFAPTTASAPPVPALNPRTKTLALARAKLRTGLLRGLQVAGLEAAFHGSL